MGRSYSAAQCNFGSCATSFQMSGSVPIFGLYFLHSANSPSGSYGDDGIFLCTKTIPPHPIPDGIFQQCTRHLKLQAALIQQLVLDQQKILTDENGGGSMAVDHEGPSIFACEVSQTEGLDGRGWFEPPHLILFAPPIAEEGLLGDQRRARGQNTNYCTWPNCKHPSGHSC